MILPRLPLATALAVTTCLAGPCLAQTPAPSPSAQEEAFLDILPPLAIPADVQPIPGAVNEEFRSCQAHWPEGYAAAQSGPEARALRDIYGLVRTRNVISSRDCSCAGKVASWEDVEAIAAALRQHHDVERLGWKQTKSISTEADRLTAIAETMCGGAF